MSCWVVPSLAAEYWGVSVENIMQKLTDGDLPTRTEHGFTLIDVAPTSPRHEINRPPVYPPASPKPYHESQIPVAVEDITESFERDSFGDFRLARIQTARLRKAPHASTLN